MIWPINIAPLYCTFDPILKKVCEGARLILIYYSMLDATKSFDFYGTWHMHKMYDFTLTWSIMVCLVRYIIVMILCLVGEYNIEEIEYCVSWMHCSRHITPCFLYQDIKHLRGDFLMNAIIKFYGITFRSQNINDQK